MKIYFNGKTFNHKNKKFLKIVKYFYLSRYGTIFDRKILLSPFILVWFFFFLLLSGLNKKDVKPQEKFSRIGSKAKVASLMRKFALPLVLLSPSENRLMPAKRFFMFSMHSGLLSNIYNLVKNKTFLRCKENGNNNMEKCWCKMIVL